ncbi:MAG TPA: asparagine synthase (glutamine-hydrolyzing) [Candidatus Dormibacteraeota bacterium]|nr:asparagine synthase (glutamine-hydrolyzing) [Candidatus Dormibacteraeota bacterium]
MCGIVGLYSLEGRRTCDRSLLLEMRDALRHRGPDDAGEYVSGPVGLAHRRLSIIDLEAGHQPIGNENGDLQIVYNGEVYNFQELRQRALTAEHRFATRTDTEVIVHLYEDLGERAVELLNGMFAFAIWDARQHRLFLARDRAGIKPLYYAEHEGWFAFASEIRPLLGLPWISREIDPRALDAFLANGYVPAPHTMFRQIRKLPAAHTLTVDADGVHTARYWQPHRDLVPSSNPEELADRLLTELDRSVRLQLVSDVPLGAFLSGGLDSSIIVALMRRHSSGRLNTFSVGIAADRNRPELDESGYARLVAQHFDTDHHTFELRTEHVLPLVTESAPYLDEPISDPAVIPTFKLAELARRHVTVVLTGEGADEMWGGYDVFRKAQVVARYRRLPRWFRHSLADPILGSLRGPAAKLVQASRTPSYVARLSHFEREARRALYTAEGNAALASAPDADEPFALDADDPFRSVARDLMEGHLAERLLLKVDRMTMAHSLEARVPFLDNDLVDLAFGVPAHFKVRGSVRKYLLRRAFGRHLPPIIERRPKHGFDLPCSQLLRTELASLVDEVVADRVVDDLIDAGSVATLWDRHRTGAADHGTQLWALLTLSLWSRTVARA